MNEEKDKIISGYFIPPIKYGSHHYHDVVKEHIRLGRTKEEAESIVNMWLTDHSTLPEKLRPGKLSAIVLQPVENDMEK